MQVERDMPVNLAWLREQARIEAIRRAARERQREIELRRYELRCGDTSVDLSVIGISLTDEQLEGVAATARQRAAIARWMKLPFEPDDLTYEAAAVILDKLQWRYANGLATFKQVKLVRRFRPHWSAERLAALTFNEAAAILSDALKPRPAGIAK